MYHINHEGKVYPCRAKILKCPYGAEMHAETREELYYKTMKVNKQVGPAPDVVQEIAITGRMRSLFSTTPVVEKVQYPIEVFISSLEYGIEAMKRNTPQSVEEEWDRFVKESGEKVYDALSYGMSIPDMVPTEIKAEGNRLLNERLNGIPIEYAHATRNRAGLKTLEPLRRLEEEFDNFETYKRFGLSDDNYEGTLGWLKEDFYQFSHDLNTSKMLTQPIFYGNIDKARQKVKELDDYELLSAYDDYLLSDREIKENVELANNFNYEYRSDLTEKANRNVKAWYDRNKKIVEGWHDNTPKRILLSIEMANELDRRGIYRQDNAIGRK